MPPKTMFPAMKNETPIPRQYRLRVDLQHVDLEELPAVVSAYFDTKEGAEAMFRVLYHTRQFPRLHLFKDDACVMKSEDGITSCDPVE